MNKDPLDAVFETPEESLAWFLKSMPPSLVPVFEREFMRRPENSALAPCSQCGGERQLLTRCVRCQTLDEVK